MANLSDSQRQLIQQLLDTREAELQEQVRIAKASRAERTSAEGPSVEDAAEDGEERFRHGLEDFDLQRDQEELRAIQEARDRIGDGTYGDCIDCGNAIPFERLKAQPSAVRCVACQSRYEQKRMPRYSTG
jgi:RNA polymerase-binding transcription factor DksA